MRWQLSGSNGAHFVCSSRRLDSTMRLPTRWPASFTPRGPSCHLSAPPRASSPRPSAPPSRTPSRLRESRHYCGSMQTRLVDSIGLRQRREPQPMRRRLFLQAAAVGSVGVVPAFRPCARVQDPANEGRAFPVGARHASTVLPSLGAASIGCQSIPDDSRAARRSRDTIYLKSARSSVAKRGASCWRGRLHRYSRRHVLELRTSHRGRSDAGSLWRGPPEG